MKARENKPVIGILEWFHLNDKSHVHRAIRQIRGIGIKELRTGISWADYHTDEGKKWLEWLIPLLSRHVQILPCLLYTPPSVGIAAKTSSPPAHPEYFADFTDEILRKYGDHFDWVELWNEPNNTSEYDFRLDPDWSLFKKFIGLAAGKAKDHKKKVLLGGMSPADPGWLDYMYNINLMENFDAVGIHGFPGTFDTDWPGWEFTVRQVQDVIEKHAGRQKIWITEAGYSTWQLNEKQQINEFSSLTRAPVDRAYWYSLNDLNSKRSTVDGFHLDEREYHFGMIDENDRPKLLYRLLKEHGISGLDRYPWIKKQHNTISGSDKSILITGGAGFIGTNLAHKFLSQGKPVTIVDNLQRPGVEANADWLRRTHSRNLNIVVADVRNRHIIQELVGRAEFIYHLAAQVAVTTSYEDPYADYETNLAGTMNLLEAIRSTSHKPPMLFTSTNKVYGNLSEYELVSDDDRYYMEPANINEYQKLDFQSPYGCSKGSADAYVLDYARSYQIPTVVFRMSCIYGPHQRGTEDQGWIAHFLIQALKEQSVTIFGDGKQVRDILYIDDLIEAFHTAYNQIDSIAGEVFNIGGGYENSISLKEFIYHIEKLTGEKINCDYSEWRSGDQKYYVSDTRKFSTMTGWEATYSASQGISHLYKWLAASNLAVISEKSGVSDESVIAQ